MSLFLPLRNFVRVQILGKNPICGDCGNVMVQRGHVRDGFVVEFKCLECDSR